MKSRCLIVSLVFALMCSSLPATQKCHESFFKFRIIHLLGVMTFVGAASGLVVATNRNFNYEMGVSTSLRSQAGGEMQSWAEYPAGKQGDAKLEFLAEFLVRDQFFHNPHFVVGVQKALADIRGRDVHPAGFGRDRSLFKKELIFLMRRERDRLHLVSDVKPRASVHDFIETVAQTGLFELSRKKKWLSDPDGILTYESLYATARWAKENPEDFAVVRRALEQKFAPPSYEYNKSQGTTAEQALRRYKLIIDALPSTDFHDGKPLDSDSYALANLLGNYILRQRDAGVELRSLQDAIDHLLKDARG